MAEHISVNDIEFKPGSTLYALDPLAHNIPCTSTTDCPGDAVFECADPHPWYSDPVCLIRDLDVLVDQDPEIVYRIPTPKMGFMRWRWTDWIVCPCSSPMIPSAVPSTPRFSTG